MVRDYAKKTFSHKRKAKKPSHDFGLYLLIILLFSLFFTGLYYKKIQPASLSKAAQLAHRAISSAISTTPTKPTSPVFEFYTLLPKKKNTLNNSNPSAPNVKPAGESYFLQIAASPHQEEVDALKAKLLLLGFDVVIKPTVVKGETWYRVNVGPYSTLSVLHTDQNRLRENHINSILQRAQP